MAQRPSERPGRLQRRWRRLGLAGLVTAFAMGALLTVTAMGAATSAREAVRLVKAAMVSADRGDGPAATNRLDDAGRAFRAGESRLSPWWVRAAERVPVAGRQIRAARAILRSGSQATEAAATAASEADIESIRLVKGALDTVAVRRLEPALQRAVETFRRVQADLSTAQAGLLLPVLDRSLAQLDDYLRRAIDEGEMAVLGARVLPDLFGADAPRRYFVAIQTPAELRGSGGMIGNFAELGANGGRLSLDRVGRTVDLNVGGDPSSRSLDGPPDYVARYGRFSPERSWQNVTMSPDFPSVAQVVTSLYPQSGGEPVDGVMSVDPIALADLLKLTGPVKVPEWPEPLSSANAADILLRRQYEHFPRAERVDFLESAVRVIFDRLTSKSLPAPAVVARTLGSSVRGGHLMLFSTRAEEQRLFERMGATGAMPEVRGDFLALVTQNAGGNKLDVFLHRAVTYRASFDPRTGVVRSEAVVRLDNRAPSSGLSSPVVGSESGATDPGENRLYLSLYSPLELEGAVLDGEALLMESERELERNVFSAYLTIPSEGSVTVRLRFSGTVPAGPQYRLDVARQATAFADRLDVELRAPNHEISSANGLELSGEVARAHFALVADRTFDLRLG